MGPARTNAQSGKQKVKQFVSVAFFFLLMGCQKVNPNIDVQGHRGCRGLLPENTIPAFLEATKLGVNTLELDVVISADGQVVVSHEPFLNPEICIGPEGQKIANAEQFNLFEMPYADIEKCDCGNLPHPRFTEQKNLVAKKPLLSAVIFIVKNFCAAEKKPLPNFNVEIKSRPSWVGVAQPDVPIFVQKVVAVLKANLPVDKFNLQSFDTAVLREARKKYPEIPLAFLDEQPGFKTINDLKADFETLGFEPEIYSCYHPMLTKEVVKFCHEKNVKVIPWTANTVEDFQHLLNLQVDGIITDYPDRLMKYRMKN